MSPIGPGDALADRLTCPRCGAPVAAGAEGPRCGGCQAVYPAAGGVFDLRLRPDRFLDLAADRAKARAVLEASAPGDLEGALEAYWSRTPETPPAEAARYRRRQRAETAIGEALLARLESRAGALAGPLLDIGAGAGGVTAAAAVRGLPVAGLDAALRWLAVTRRRLETVGAGALLVAARAEQPPFAPETFHTLIANDLLEWLDEPDAALAAWRRLLAPGGRLYLASCRRGGPLAPRAVRAWTRSEARAALEAAGWRVIAAGPAPVYAAHLHGWRATAAAVAGRLGARFELVAEPVRRPGALPDARDC